jgi:hypothetical protein
VTDLGPFHNRPEEWALYQPLTGKTMLELGNKRNEKFVYKTFFKSLGFQHTSVDINGSDGALPKDLTQPLGLGTFDMVSNVGTSEHVSEGRFEGQVECWRNICEAMHVGSVLVSTTPKPGAWRHHGVWYPHPEFYTELAELNGLEVERLFVDDTAMLRGIYADREMVFARLRRVEAAPFAMPEGGMYCNRRVTGTDRRLGT